MKKDGLLFAALALLGVGIYFFFRNKGVGARTPATATTGSNPYAPANSFAGLVGARGSVAAARTGSQGGASVDLSGAATAGVNAIGALARKALDAILGAGNPNNRSTSPGTTPVQSPVDRTPFFSTWEDYQRAIAAGQAQQEADTRANSEFPGYNEAILGGGVSDDFADVFEDDGSGDTYSGELV